MIGAVGVEIRHCYGSALHERTLVKDSDKATAAGIGVYSAEGIPGSLLWLGKTGQVLSERHVGMARLQGLQPICPSLILGTLL